MSERIASKAHPIKVGVIAAQADPLSFAGRANANVARMVIGDINARSGLLGKPFEPCLENSATDDAVAAMRARKLVNEDHVDVHFWAASTAPPGRPSKYQP